MSEENSSEKPYIIVERRIMDKEYVVVLNGGPVQAFKIENGKPSLIDPAHVPSPATLVSRVTMSYEAIETLRQAELLRPQSFYGHES